MLSRQPMEKLGKNCKSEIEILVVYKSTLTNLLSISLGVENRRLV